MGQSLIESGPTPRRARRSSSAGSGEMWTSSPVPASRTWYHRAGPEAFWGLGLGFRGLLGARASGLFGVSGLGWGTVLLIAFAASTASYNKVRHGFDLSYRPHTTNQVVSIDRGPPK